jgi:hypothetical protein
MCLVCHNHLTTSGGCAPNSLIHFDITHRGESSA